MNKSTDIYGCPNCFDEGGIVIEAEINGVFRYWLIDLNSNEIPDFLWDYTDQIKELIN